MEKGEKKRTFPMSTKQVAEAMGVAVHNIRWLINSGQVVPDRGPSGQFLWRKIHFLAVERIYAERRAIQEGAGRPPL